MNGYQPVIVNVGVMGSGRMMRSDKDMKMLQMYKTCDSKEGYNENGGVDMPNQYYGERTARDKQMLAQYNGCSKNEGFQYNGINFSDHAKRNKLQQMENYCGCAGSQIASIMDDPYNPMSSCAKLRPL